MDPFSKYGGKRPKRPRDASQLAREVMLEATGQLPPTPPDARNPHAVALGKLGGSKGGKARAKRLSAKRRSEIAQKAANARWGKKG